MNKKAIIIILIIAAAAYFFWWKPKQEAASTGSDSASPQLGGSSSGTMNVSTPSTSTTPQPQILSISKPKVQATNISTLTEADKEVYGRMLSWLKELHEGEKPMEFATVMTVAKNVKIPFLQAAVQRAIAVFRPSKKIQAISLDTWNAQLSQL